MANLTLILSPHDEILKRAREAALNERISVNALVCNYLTHYVDAKSRRLDVLFWANGGAAIRNHPRSTAVLKKTGLPCRH